MHILLMYVSSIYTDLFHKLLIIWNQNSVQAQICTMWSNNNEAAKDPPGTYQKPTEVGFKYLLNCISSITIVREF